MKRTSKIKNGILALVVFTILIAIVGGTYARYSSTGTASTSTSFAKWSIQLGTEDISSVSKTINVTLNTDDNNENVSAGKIAPGKSLSGTFVVDPSGSEVAVDYILTLGNIITDGFNTNSKISLSRVTATLDGNTSDITVINNSGKFAESLTDVISNKAVTFTVYVTWDNDNDSNNLADTANGNTVASITVPVKVIARQHLAGDSNIVTPISELNGIVDSVSTLSAGDTVLVSESLDYRNDYEKNQRVQLNFPDNVTLDLDGNTITTMNGGLIYSGNNLTIKNGIFTGLNDNEGRGRAYGLCLYDFKEDSFSNNVLVADSVLNGGVTIYKEDVTFENVNATAANYYAVYGNSDTKITINSGTYTATENTLALLGFSRENNTREDFVINGGTFITNGKPFYLSSGLIPTIHGGTFDTDVTTLLDEGYVCTLNSTTGLYDVTQQ